MKIFLPIVAIVTILVSTSVALPSPRAEEGKFYKQVLSNRRLHGADECAPINKEQIDPVAESVDNVNCIF